MLARRPALRHPVLALLVGGCVESGSLLAEPVEPTLYISEIQVGSPDWIELWNPGSSAVPLGGWSLADDGGDPVPLDPTLAVPAGGALLLWADGAPSRGPAHLPFRLSADGDRLRLLRAGEPVDDRRFGPLVAGWSLARSGDGTDDWAVTTEASPGLPNATLPPRPGTGRPDCDPVAAADVEAVLEGEDLAVALTCASGSLEGVEVRVLSTDGSGAWDADSARWQRPTADGDAGSWPVLFELKAEGRRGVPRTARATVEVIDAIARRGNVPADPARYTSEYGIPVLHLFPDGPVGEEYVPATAWFGGRAWGASMKVRGAASAGYPKHHYTVEFEPEQADLAPLGLGSKDHIVLMSNFDDNAYVRQKLIFDAWAAMRSHADATRYAPRTDWVVLYLDGRWHGLYLAADHIDAEFIEESGGDRSGNLYKSVNHDANFYATDSGGQPKDDLAAGWEKKEGAPDDFSDLIALVAWSAGATDDVFAAEVDRWLELGDFLDWWALVVHFAAADSAGKNAYLHADPATGRFAYIPWDFNHGLGQDWRTLRVGADWYSDFAGNNGIFRHLLEHPGRRTELEGRYAALRAEGAPLSADWLVARATEQWARIEPVARRDESVWADAYRSYGGWAGARDDAADWLDAAGELAYTLRWIVDREAEMAARFPAP